MGFNFIATHAHHSNYQWSVQPRDLKTYDQLQSVAQYFLYEQNIWYSQLSMTHVECVLN